MNIILINKKIKSTAEKNYTFLEKDLEELESMNLISSKSKNYQLILNHRKYQLICPLKVEKGKIVGVYLPALKSPYRPYPCYVYLYSVIMHLTGHSMRYSAKLTGKKFGIKNFSHSTISRVLAILLSKVEFLSQIDIDNKINSSNDNQKPIENTSQKPNSYPGKPHQKITSETKYIDYKKDFLKKILYNVSISCEFGIELVYQFYIKFNTLLI